MAFQIEVIPDASNLFRRIHHTHLLPDGGVSSAAFKQERMSVNWDKYSTAEEAADQNSLAVVSLVAGECRALGQIVKHAPVEATDSSAANQAHAEVCGNKSGVISRRLRDMAGMVWRRPLEA